MNQYHRIIGQTYWNQNYFNVDVVASHHLGNHNEPLTIVFPNNEIIQTTINRTINGNGSVRFYGGLQWHNFIQDNYNLYDAITFQVTNPNTITIIPNE